MQETQKRRECTESREAGRQQNKQHPAPMPRAPGAGNQRKLETTGAQNERGKKTEHREAATKTARHNRGGGGQQPPRSNHGEAGHTNEARAHGEPRSGRPTKQTTHSAKAQGTRGRKPEKASDKGGAQRTGKKKEHREAAFRPRVPWTLALCFSSVPPPGLLAFFSLSVRPLCL